MVSKKDYYQGYEARYSQIYQEGELWFTTDPTPEVEKFLEGNHVTKTQSILDLGRGEGRDAIALLRKGFTVFASDYSRTAVEKCRELTHHQYDDHFRQFDLLQDTLETAFDFIYSIGVLHLFILEEHQKAFWRFIRNHLKQNGKALVSVLGNGTNVSDTGIDVSERQSRTYTLNNGHEITLPTLTCKIVDWKTLETEIAQKDLLVEQKWISKEIPGFDSSMCVVVKSSDSAS